MSEKKRHKRIISPEGIASFPHLNTPDTKFDADGTYKVTLRVKTELAEAFIKEIEAVFDEHFDAVAKEQKATKAKPLKVRDPSYAVETDEDGNETGFTTFKFKSNAKIKGRNGEIIEIAPAFFNSKGEPLSRKKTKIGGGSVLKVSCELVPTYSKLVGYGITLRLRAVQVLELKTWGEGGSAESFGFGQEDGYEAVTETEDDDASATESEDDEPEADEPAPRTRPSRGASRGDY